MTYPLSRGGSRLLFFNDCLGANVDNDTGALAAVKCVMVSLVVVGGVVLVGEVFINDTPDEEKKTKRIT